MLLHQLHALRVQALRVLLVFLGELGHLRRQLSLLDHRLSLVDQLELLQRRKDQADDDCQEDDRDPIRSDHVEDRNAHDVRVDERQGGLQGDSKHVPPQRVDGVEDVERRAG